MTPRTYTIGQVAYLSGVPVKRLRFYADRCSSQKNPAGWARRSTCGLPNTKLDQFKFNLGRHAREGGHPVHRSLSG
jgi:hypothetical protein